MILIHHQRSGFLTMVLAICVMTVAPSCLIGQSPAKTTIAEALFGSKSGADKKQAALSFVGAALSMTDAIANREIVNADQFRDGLSKIIDGVVACLNASVWAKS